MCSSLLQSLWLIWPTGSGTNSILYSHTGFSKTAVHRTSNSNMRSTCRVSLIKWKADCRGRWSWRGRQEADDKGSRMLCFWRRKWQPTPVFLPGESHGQRSLADYCPWDRKESDRTEQLNHQSPPRSVYAQTLFCWWWSIKVFNGRVRQLICIQSNSPGWPNE